MRTAPTDTDPEETLMERMGLDVLSPEVTATGRRHTEQYGRGLLRTERATGTYDGPSEQGETEPERGEETDLPLLEADRTGINVPSDLLAEEQAKDTFIRVIKAYLLEEAVPFDRDAIKHRNLDMIDKLAPERMEVSSSGNDPAMNVELPGSDHDEEREARSRSDLAASPTPGSAFQGCFQDRGRPGSQVTVRRLFRSPQGCRQPVAVDESWTYGRPTGPAPDCTVPTDATGA
ncbi:hypothetical protein DYB36_005190 [Aphanomyces astaci]|uniref:Uncharacterized protein n=1 Tax=Aphanomyces astaci TaxID=112090 RepID=A0A397AWH3_APHAT|nr:hypothetical protein DYB36_005190 [Aphanomyces astaci]